MTSARAEPSASLPSDPLPSWPPSDRRESVADEARRYIESRPSIRDCLRYDIVNFTALARRIRSETGLASQEAVEIACRRYRRQMQEGTSQEEQLREVLRASHMEIRTHVAAVTARGDLEFLERLVLGTERILSKRDRLVQLFQGSGAVTVLCDEEILGAMLGVIPRATVLDVERRLSVVTIRSSEDVLATPRVLGFLAEAIGRAGINCVEMTSVYTDTLFVFRAPDAVRAFEILSDLSRALDDHRSDPIERAMGPLPTRAVPAPAPAPGRRREPGARTRRPSSR
ncbi:MAG: hypothetical protein WBS16_04620 [Thermoplasmata archaeon]